MTPEQCADAILSEVIYLDDRRRLSEYRHEMVNHITAAIAADRAARAAKFTPDAERRERSFSFIDSLFQDDTTDAARYGLLMLMTGISESAWCAGWMDGLEFALWEVDGGRPYGQEVITHRQAGLLKLLSEEAGGWWRFDKEKGATFVLADEWENLVRSRESKT